MKTFDYTINDELGIHVRPAGLLAKAADKYKCSVQIVKEDKKADAKKVFAVMGLGAKCGNTIQVITEGEDEEAASMEIKEILQTYL